jgi:hypothetical protein
MTVPHYINHIHKAFRAEFVTSLLIAVFVFVFAMAHAAISEPAPAYNCGDRGVRYCIVEYSYPECGDSEPARDSPAIMASQSLGPLDTEPCRISAKRHHRVATLPGAAD